MGARVKIVTERLKGSNMITPKTSKAKSVSVIMVQVRPLRRIMLPLVGGFFVF